MALGIVLWNRLRQKHMFPSVSPGEGQVETFSKGVGRAGLVSDLLSSHGKIS